jgi:fructose-1,6-bisphosphatase I
VLVKSKIRIPEAAAHYSINEAYRRSFPPGIGRYLDWAHEHGYSSRYIGSMVSDIHRILLKGGVFLYPPTNKNPTGKLRLMYEASPMAMVVEQAGGLAVAAPATDGSRSEPVGRRILDIQPTSIHERTSLVIGSPREVERVMGHW